MGARVTCDPDATLELAREASKAMKGYSSGRPVDPALVMQLEDAFDALDRWLSQAGQLPEEWRRRDGSQ